MIFAWRTQAICKYLLIGKVKWINSGKELRTVLNQVFNKISKNNESECIHIEYEVWQKKSWVFRMLA
jgi:hypothetical protein